MFKLRRVGMVVASALAAFIAANVDSFAHGGLPNPYRPVQGLADGGGPFVPGGGWARLPGGRQMGPPASVYIDIDGESLTDDEFGFFVIMLAVAGNETSRNSTTHGMIAFAQHPEQWELYKRERPETAVDEIVRWATPVERWCWTVGARSMR